jgi:histidyl-tRNA synthetase
MVPDAEVITVACEVLEQLDIGNIMVKLSHRQLLHAMVTSCGVSEAQFKPICSAIDKLDKEPWAEVRREMIDEKGLDPAAADKIGELVVHKVRCSFVFVLFFVLFCGSQIVCFYLFCSHKVGARRVPRALG